MNVFEAIQAALLALSIAVTYLIVREARRGRKDETTARRNNFERERLIDRERRLYRVADAVVDFADVWASPTIGGQHEMRQTVVRMRLQAALDAVGYTLPAAHKLLNDDEMIGAYISLAQEALAEVGRNLNGIAAATLLPPPSEYYVPQRRSPRRWPRRRPKGDSAE